VQLHLEQLEYRLVPATFVVAGLGDTGGGKTNEGDLRYCIGQANASKDTSNTITFAGGLNGTISLTGALPAIANGVTIDPGNDAITVQGNANAGKPYSVFSINKGVTAEIDGLWIEGGFAGTGGGINNAGNLTLKNDTITNNTATMSGGGVFNALGSSLSLDSDVIQFNQADAGGGVFNSGSIRSDSEYDSTKIIANTATSDGGGIYTVGTVNFYGFEEITGNTANTTSGVGGGVYNGSTATFDTSGGQIDIYNNDAFQGGGFYNVGTATLTADFEGNSANQGGGLFLVSISTTTFNTVTVSGNKLVGAGAVGQGVYYQKGATMNGLNTLTDSDDPGGQPVQSP
jgi:predicted outer membrane repeat protein